MMDARAVPSAHHICVILSLFYINFLVITIRLLFDYYQIIRLELATTSLLD